MERERERERDLSPPTLPPRFVTRFATRPRPHVQDGTRDHELRVFRIKTPSNRLQSGLNKALCGTVREHFFQGLRKKVLCIFSPVQR